MLFSLSNIPTRKDAPIVIKLFSWGANETSKGTFYLTKEGADLIVNAWKDQGNKLNIDYNHAQLFSANPEESISAGTFDLEIRDLGLYAVQIEWTDRAKNLIESKEYLYISPAFLTNDNGEVVELINFALTNIPATKHMDQLLAASKQGLINMELEQETLAEDMPTEDMPMEQPSDEPSEEVDLKAAYEELKAVVESLKAEVEMIKESLQPKEEPQQEMSKEEDSVESLKKELVIKDAIIAGKILPGQADKYKEYELTKLSAEIEELKPINLSANKQIIEFNKPADIEYDSLVNKFNKMLGVK